MRNLFLTTLLLVLIGCASSGNKFTIETSEGDIKGILYDNTPKHKEDFIKRAKSGEYSGVIFHRVIKDFMIQSGDPDSKNPIPDKMYGNGGTSGSVEAEIVPSNIHKRGALAAARQSDQVNPLKKSSSQFYIVQGTVYTIDQLTQLENKRKLTNPDFKFSDEAKEIYMSVGGTPFLDGEYTVFGEVTHGMDIVEKIAITKVNTQLGDRPVKDIIIKRIKIY